MQSEELREDVSEMFESKTAHTSPQRKGKGYRAVWQARVIMLVLINVAQLWILAATIEAGLARHLKVLVPLVIASAFCFLITLSIVFRWRTTSKKYTSTGYITK